MKLKIKVCGMSQASNIAAVADLQPDYLGFIFYQKSPRAISEVSAELIKYVPDSIKTVGIFVNEDLEIVIDKVQKFKLKAIQLHGNEEPAYCEALKETGVEVIKAFGVG
ncbi:MAG: phosphoribosylanthranilate isomerase, partial [Chitinophagaceae bacterium]